MSAINFIDLSTQALLEKFGAGSHKPGSGSAAALVGILAGKLICTVVVLTKEKEAYAAVHSQAQFIADQIASRFEPALYEAFQKDAEVFDQVIDARKRRNAEFDQRRKREMGEMALERLREATEIPMGVCRDCLSVAELGLGIYDIGFKGARGDSGAAVSVSLAGAFSALSVIYLNLNSFRSGTWARETRKEADELFRSSRQLQEDLFSRTTVLRSEGEDEPQLTLPF
jgi:formiminotetrahydrofolate cyclodeaminase